MNNFNRNRSNGGSRFGDRDQIRPMMHKATCSECGKACEVPFMPSGDRPIFCNDCFAGKRRGEGVSRPPMVKEFRRSSFENRSVASQPFKSFAPRPQANDNLLTDQINNLNFKLDKIISLLADAQKKSSEDSTVAKITVENDILTPSEKVSFSKVLGAKKKKKVALKKETI